MAQNADVTAEITEIKGMLAIVLTTMGVEGSVNVKETRDGIEAILYHIKEQVGIIESTLYPS